MEATKDQMSEALLEGWLAMSLAISNERLVKAMTYNESMVCGFLYRQRKEGGEPLTATELCEHLSMKKSQMNLILNRLESQGLIKRERSSQDKRQVYLFLTDQGVPFYEKAHSEILRLPRGVIERMGQEKAGRFTELMKEAAACFRRMQEEEKDRERKEKE